MSSVERLLAVGRWRWTPCLGLTLGTTTFVLGLAAAVPDHIGAESNAPQQRSVAPPPPDAEPDEPPQEPSSTTATSIAPRPRPPMNRSSEPRRRGFSPVIRSDSPVMADPPPIPEQEPSVSINQPVAEDVNENPDFAAQGQEAANRAMRRAAALVNPYGGRPRTPPSGMNPQANIDDAEPPPSEVIDGSPNDDAVSEPAVEE